LRRSTRFTPSARRFCSADDGWFTVAGLHFLNPGENKFGSDPLNDIVLEYSDVPKQAGVITMNGTTVTIKAADGQTLNYNGKPAKTAYCTCRERQAGGYRHV
jgi:hypothetical protein